MSLRTGWRKTVTPAKLADSLLLIRKENEGAAFWFVCIGTDRSTGDAFGPLTGTYLIEKGISCVTGTLKAPCDASTLTACLAAVPEGVVVIGVDASVGPAQAVGRYTVAQSSLFPGRSLGKLLPEVGTYAITGIVAENHANPYAVLQRTSLHLVMNMAERLAAEVCLVFGGT